ncbi:hypothetical protein AB0O82_12040 [Kitasatospora sp. NPDC088264]|uniref:hypothetical protein n=1 Tax=unclassified Kitasatospora TaxID=2633591 RepID=UPI003415A783
MDDGQDDYRDTARKSARGDPTPVTVAVAYTVSLLAARRCTRICASVGGLEAADP